MKKLNNSQESPTFIPYPSYNISMEVKAKNYKQEGDLGYIYQPFRNLKISSGEDKGKLSILRTDKFNFSFTFSIF